MSRVRLPGLVLALVAVVATPAGARAAGLRDVDDGWLVPAAGPAADDPDGRLWLTLGSMRLHGMPELATWSVAAGGGRGRPLRPQFALSWQRTGRDLFRADAWRAHLAWGGGSSVGLEARGERLVLGGAGEAPPVQRRWLALVGRLERSWPTGRVTARIHLPLAGGGLRRLRSGRRPLARLVWTGPRAALGGDLSRDRAGRPVVGWAVQWRTGDVTLGLRGEPATGVVGPLLAVRRGGLVVRTSHAVHPVLGMTHRVQVGWGALERCPW